MANHSTLTRTAPIAIAPKPARKDSLRQDSYATTDSYRNGSMPGRESTEASYNGRVASPCDICQRFRLKCTLSDGDDGDDSCLPCQNRGSECSFAASPPARKRKLNGHLANDGKRRLVPPLHTHLSIPVCLYRPSLYRIWLSICLSPLSYPHLDSSACQPCNPPTIYPCRLGLSSHPFTHTIFAVAHR